MRQIGGETEDPLKRIQEEINEVERRERELKEKFQLHQKLFSPSPDEASAHGSKSPIKDTSSIDGGSLYETASEPDNHSDDSGISASPSPVNGHHQSQPIPNHNHQHYERGYIRPNSYTAIPNPPPQKLLTRMISTPQLNGHTRRFNVNPAQRGIMQRFIAMRGRVPAAKSQTSVETNRNDQEKLSVAGKDNEAIRPNFFPVPMATITPPIIERDADGKPIRRGFIPVEEKIQKELKDIKNRESELKRLRKMSSRQSQPDLLDGSDKDFDSGDDSDVEHCYGPRKLRNSKSISELCDALDSSSLSRRTTPSPSFERTIHNGNGNHHRIGLRPALSLAALCDLDPEEAPSSHQLIAKFESIIQKNHSK